MRLSTRYSANADADLAPLAGRLQGRDETSSSRRHPRDTDAAVLYAESLMDLHPWKLWAPDGTPAEGTLELVRVLERAQAQQPDHIGAYTITCTRSKRRRIRKKRSRRRSGWRTSPRRRDTWCTCRRTFISAPAITSTPSGSSEAAARADERLAASGARSFYLVAYYGHNLHFLAICNAIAGNFARGDGGG